MMIFNYHLKLSFTKSNCELIFLAPPPITTAINSSGGKFERFICSETILDVVPFGTLACTGFPFKEVNLIFPSSIITLDSCVFKPYKSSTLGLLSNVKLDFPIL